MSALICFIITAGAIIAADLWLKSWSFRNVAGAPVVDGFVPPHDGLELVPRVLTLKLVKNYGAVFGIGQGGRWVFACVSVLAIAVIVTIFMRTPPKARAMHTALALILGGAIGNLYDRITTGWVRDMLYLFPGVRLPFGLHWPGGSNELYPWVFNIADAALCVGVLLVITLMLRKPAPRG